MPAERRAASHWLVKQEPEDYPWDRFVAEEGTLWTGVRNFQARNHLRQMRPGDAVLYYHSGEAREVVGIARVRTAPSPDPTADEGDWTAVGLVPDRALPSPVPLPAIKANPKQADLALVRQSRLSVMPVAPAEFDEILRMAGRRSQA